jgi:polysaccharide biosynthesis/export protein
LRRTTARAVLRLCALLIAAAHLSACANTGVVFGPAVQSMPPPAARMYRLGVGDKLKLSVFGEENLSGQLEVSASGSVSPPLIGEIRAQGLTLAEFRDEVVRRLSAGYLQHPKIAVDIVNYRPIYVHGEVKNGGEFAFKNGLKLRDAVALAGGYTYRADQTLIRLGRDEQAEMAVAATGDMPVLPGDNIRIPERLF